MRAKGLIALSALAAMVWAVPNAGAAPLVLKRGARIVSSNAAFN